MFALEGDRPACCTHGACVHLLAPAQVLFMLNRHALLTDFCVRLGSPDDLPAVQVCMARVRVGGLCMRAPLRQPWDHVTQ